jgi:hypothetical protein
MKMSNLLRRCALSILILALVQGSFTFAKQREGSGIIQPQKPASAQTSDDEFLKICQKALVEVDALRKIRKLSDEERQALNDKIAALESLVQTHREIAAQYKAAAAERAAANNIDSERVRVYESMLADYKQERSRLIGERDRARRNGRLFGFVGVILGAGAVLLLRNN